MVYALALAYIGFSDVYIVFALRVAVKLNQAKEKIPNWISLGSVKMG